MQEVAARELQAVPAITFTVVSNCDDLNMLQPDWDALFGRARGRSLHFASFAWCQQWWLQYGDAADVPLVVVGRLGDRVVLIWPLQLSSGLGGRTLSTLGMPLTQYSDVLVEDDDCASQWIVEAQDHLRKSAVGDLLELARVRDDSALSAALMGVGAEVDARQHAPTLDLTRFDDIDAYRMALSKKARKHRKRMRRLLSELGELKFQISNGGPEAAAAIDRAFDFKAAWLDEKGLVSAAIGDSRTREFWKSLTENGEAAGLVVSELRCGDVSVAVEIGLRCRGRHVAHVGSYNPEYEQFSPGTVQMEDTIRDCMENGIEVYDLLPPDDEYKLRWANQSEDVSDYAFALGGRGRVLKGIGAMNVKGIIKTGFYSLPKGMRKTLAGVIRTSN